MHERSRLPIARPEDHDDAPPAGSRYQRLDGRAVLAAAASLQDRIRARFPTRSLWEVGEELVSTIDEVVAGEGISVRRIRTARLFSRLGVVAVMLVFGMVLLLAGASLWSNPGELGPVDWLPLIDTVVNDLVFAGVAVFFLLAVPPRMERHRVLRVLHQLRSLAHVVDMHQLDKVPERLEHSPSAGGTALTRTQMTQYLDYCTEMLSLIGKAAALFGEDSTDGDTLDAMEGMEALTSDMARKVWQKIAILQARQA